MRINSNYNLAKIFDYDISKKNRQELEKVYYPNGCVQVFKYNNIKNKQGYYTNKTFAYLMPPERSVDIDSEFDFKLVEFLLKKNKTQFKKI